ncbi:unnamed protein product [Peniophora sp. CBMAI 1063]|nr:unnamed protein product [Peniophora sp. CBMAI 1063]
MSIDQRKRFLRQMAQLEDKDIERLNTVMKRIVDLPDDTSKRTERLREVAVRFWFRFERRDKLDNLRDAIILEKHALGLTPDDDLEMPERLGNLAISLHTRFERLGELRDVEEAITAETLALELTPEDHSEWPERLGNLAISLCSRFVRLGELQDLEDAIAAQRVVLDLTPADDSERPERLGELAVSLYNRYERLGELKDLEDTIAAHKLALDLTLDDQAERPERLGNLAVSLHARFGHLGELKDLDDAISAQRLVLDLTPERHSERRDRLGGLASSLHTRFQRLGELKDLEDAITAQRDVLDLTPKDHPEWPEQLRDLAIFLHARFQRLGELQDLEDAISRERLALERTPEDHSGRPERLGTLAGSLHARFTRLGEIKDLEDAITTQRLALELTPDDHSKRPDRLRELATSLLTRFQRLAETNDLEDSIAARMLVLELTPDDHHERHDRLRDLAVSLHARFVRCGDLKDLEDAIAAQRLILELTPEDHVERLVRLRDLSRSLHARFNRLEELKDLEEVIDTQRMILSLTPEDHPDWPDRVGDLAVSLYTRFLRLDELEDLEDAVAAQRTVLDRTPEDHYKRPKRLTELAIFLRNRFSRLDKLDDLEAAIATQQLALSLTPDNHSERPDRLAVLANSLYVRYMRLGKDLKDLEDAISAQRLVLDLTPADHPTRPERLRVLAVTLRARHWHLAERKDLDESNAIETLVLALTPEGHPDLVDRLYDIGQSMKVSLEQTSKYSQTHRKVNQDDFMAAFGCFLKAMTVSGNPSRRFDAALQCLSLLSEYPDFSSDELLLEVYTRIKEIIPELVWLGHSIKRRYGESAKIRDVVNGAIAVLVRSHSATEAIEWMEVGRSLVWSQITTLRDPLIALSGKRSGLVRELREVSMALQSTRNGVQRTFPDVHGPSDNMDINGTAFSSMTVETAADKHRKLAARYDDILKRIREQEGFEDFLCPLSVTGSMPSIKRLHGPVVFINVHSTSCDALALLPSGDVRHIPLPGLTATRADSLRSAWTRMLQSAHVRTRAAVMPWHARAGDRHSTLLERVLHKLWLWLVCPVLQDLDLMGSTNATGRPLPHITWCPTGPLMQLPLHAAGVYAPDASRDAKPQRAFDFVVSSYIPSLSALLRTRESARAESSTPETLVICQPATPNHSPLPGTQHEHARISAVLPAPTITLLNDKDATVDRAISEMRSNTWVHLACHGFQDPKDPTQSAFALIDGPLTLSTLMSEVAENAEFAFLSACQTAVGDEKVPEESAHLAAGMLAVGFKGVIATMWSIGDADAPIVVEAYYKKLLELRGTSATSDGYTGAAYALHEAVRVLREHVGERNFVRWAPFVHFGV